MSDLVTAAKTLKALGDDDDGLKCVESDPPEIQRSALKKIRRAAGPAVAAFTMGILKYPRRAQGALMDALYAARSTLYAADAESLFFRQGSGGGNKSAVMGKSMINRRSSTASVGASTTQGTLAARRVGIEMLREYGAQVGDDEDLGRTKFELTVATGGLQPAAAAMGLESKEVSRADHQRRVDAAVLEASRMHAQSDGSERSSNSGRSRGPGPRVRENPRWLEPQQQAEGAKSRASSQSREEAIYPAANFVRARQGGQARQSPNPGTVPMQPGLPNPGKFVVPPGIVLPATEAANDMREVVRECERAEAMETMECSSINAKIQRLLREATRFKRERMELLRVKAKVTENVKLERAPLPAGLGIKATKALVDKRMRIVASSMDLLRTVRQALAKLKSDVELIQAKVDFLRGELQRRSGQLQAIREDAWNAKEELQLRMQAVGPIFRLRVEGRWPGAEGPGKQWTRMTRVGREVTVYITNDRGAAQQAARHGFEVRGLQDDSRASAMSSMRSGRSYDPTWEPDGETLASSSSGSVTQSMHGSIGGDGGEVPDHDCQWKRIRNPNKTWGSAVGRNRDPALLRCMRCARKADFGCTQPGCGNLTCANCFSEVSMLLEAGAGGGSDPSGSSWYQLTGRGGRRQQPLFVLPV